MEMGEGSDTYFKVRSEVTHRADFAYNIYVDKVDTGKLYTPPQGLQFSERKPKPFQVRSGSTSYLERLLTDDKGHLIKNRIIPKD